MSPAYLESGLGHTHTPFPVPALVLHPPMLVIFTLWNSVRVWLWLSLQGFLRDWWDSLLLPLLAWTCRLNRDASAHPSTCCPQPGRPGVDKHEAEAQ